MKSSIRNWKWSLMAVVVMILLESDDLTCLAMQTSCDLVYSGNVFDATATLVACNQAMQDPLLPIAYLENMTQSDINVTTSFVVNNLLNIDEIESTATFDFYYRNSWVDERWDIPGIFDALDTTASQIGLELYPLTQRNDNNLEIFLPDIEFLDVAHLEVLQQSLKLYRGGYIFWSRHIIMTLSQPQFDLSLYPLDSQSVIIRYWSYAFTMGVLPLRFPAVAVRYVSGDGSDEYSFTKNPVWVHTAGEYMTRIFTSDYSVNDFPRVFQTMEVTLDISRDGRGILSRYALPILILVLLAGVTFWSYLENRVDTTLTLLLSVSALYVVVLGNVPQVGYSTDFDVWIFAMYCTMAVCVCIHQATVQLDLDKEKFPVLKVQIKLFELFGRCTVIPIAMSMYGETFLEDSSTKVWFDTTFYCIMGLTFIVFAKECVLIYHTCQSVCDDIKAKIDLYEQQKISPIPIHKLDKVIVLRREIIFLNLFTYGIISSSTSRYLSYAARVKRRAAETTVGEIQMSDVVEFHDGRKRTVSVANSMHTIQDSDDDEEDVVG